MSQKRKILSHLLSGKTLTRLQSFKLFGCFELSARIGELEREINISIDRNSITVGEGKKKVKEYFIKDLDYATNRIKEVSLL